MTRTLTGQQALDTLGEVVAEFGDDYTYQPPASDTDTQYIPPRYIWDGQPSCLVAHALVRHGVTVENLLNFEGSTALLIRQIGDLKLTDAARHVLNAAQEYQDVGNAWGNCLREARVTLRRFANDGR